MILQGNSIRIPLRDESVHACITSPPYFGLRDYSLKPTIWGGRSGCQHEWQTGTITNGGGGERDYGSHDGGVGRGPSPKLPDYATCSLCGAFYGCFGLEPTIAMHVQNVVLVCREIKRVLRKDGVLFINYGDSYSTSRNGRSAADTKKAGKDDRTFRDKPFSVTELPAKNLCLIPFRVALALQDDGWIVRSDIIWSKNNPMPESVTDRPSKSHEYIFMLVKSARYYYDQEAIREPQVTNSQEEALKRAGNYGSGYDRWEDANGFRGNGGLGQNRTFNPAGRNKRTVWTIPTESYSSVTKYDRATQHYAGGDGKPYIVSPDCPIHSPRFESQKSETLEYDEQQEAPESGNPGTDASHVQEPSFGPLATKSPDSQGGHLSRSDYSPPDDTRLRTPESIGGYKSEAGHPVHTSDAKTQSRTSHTLESDDAQDHKRDSGGQENLSSATDHNIQTHRTGRALVTSPLDNVSAQTTFHTGDKPALPLPSDLVERTHASNTLGDSSSYGPDSDPSVQTIDHSERRQNVPSSNYTCTCQKVKTDHYATFPRKLVEPMILAATSSRGVCPECGKPWERLVEKNLIDDGKSAKRGKSRDAFDNRDEWGKIHGSYQVTTTGWQPTCKHTDQTPMPAVILDCFCGSGTVGAVSRELGRRFIGIDLSARYLTENALPRSEKLTSLGTLKTLPMFADLDEAA